MLILNIEDNIFKHLNICKALRNGGISNLNIDNARNLQDGLECIADRMEAGSPYDMIITDMWYPEYAGGDNVKAGEMLMQTIQQRGWNTPVILCSTVDYSYPGIVGCVHYSEREEWESRLVNLVKKTEQKGK